MSVSPQPGSAVIPNHITSPPLPSPNGNIINQSNAQLASLLHHSYCDTERLTKELNNTKKRLDRAERLLSDFQAITVNGAPLTAEARRIVEDADARVAHADRQRDEAEARKRVILESYDELNKYLTAIESRAADARAGFQRTLRDAGGHLVLTPIPAQLQHEHSPFSANPSITVEPPPRSYHRAHRYTSSLTSSILPPGPLPPPPSTRGVRPRSGSFDDPAYLVAPSQPPAKRPRNERAEYDPRPPPSATSISRGRIPDLDPHPHPHPHPQQLPHLQHSQHPNRHLIIHPHKSHSHSRSSSHSSIRATSQDIEDLLLDAATDERGALSARDQQPQSPRAVIAAHQQSRGGIPVGPLDQPGELRTYQTHIFAPPVTGAPQKKGKLGSSTNIAQNGSPLPTPINITTPSLVPVPPPSIPAPTSFPPTNAHGQRICRQCGMPGRYKDGKCVEKWGPGPDGPGTVCDRCRKKMKRVERRGTADVSGITNNGSVARLHRTDTIPVGVMTHGGPQRQTQSQSQSQTQTQVFGASASASASFLAPSAPLQEKKRAGGSAKEREREREREKEKDRTRDPPSPPAIATLQTTDDEDLGRRRRGVVTSAQHLPSPHSDPNPDTDPDADADADGEGDADVDAELREAADAAAVEHRSASSAGMKEEDRDMEVGE
ncbi:hypothetical protein AZE42_06678 [Rhizopogon vesiculosus]|uniref:Uncharacterized protein n=1 Tax=Rhizopogon vesiculosus TaxID=180088 RepID=A0A1J8R415_9AGAM|nr:hypothetical protein AZE42_06678 [Rhizopogon vesiculosus]